jgi:hypothetical protein
MLAQRGSAGTVMHRIVSTVGAAQVFAAGDVSHLRRSGFIDDFPLCRASRALLTTLGSLARISHQALAKRIDKE